METKKIGYLLDVHYLNVVYQNKGKKEYITNMMKLFWDEKEREFFWWDYPNKEKHIPYVYVYNKNRTEDIFSENMDKPEGHTYTVSKDFKLDPKANSKISKTSIVKKYNPMLRETLRLKKYYFKSPDDINRWIHPQKLDKEKIKDLDHKEKRDLQDYYIYEKFVKYTVRFAIDKKLWYGMPYNIDSDTIEPIISEELSMSMISAYDKLKPFDISEDIMSNLLPLLLEQVPSLPSVTLDIEVATRGNILPNPDIGPEPITAISFYFSDDNVFDKIKGLVLCLDTSIRKIKRGFNMEAMTLIKSKDLVVEWFSCEINLLERLKIILYESKAALITTFMGDGFDLKYISNRMKLLNVRTPFRFRGRRGTDKEYMTYEPVDIDGDLDINHYKLHLDLYPFFKHPFIQGYAFNNKYKNHKLNTIAIALIGQGKVEHDDSIGDMSLWDLIYYNYIDSKITSNLMYFNNSITIRLILMFMRLGIETFSQYRYGITNKIGNLFLWRCNGRNWILPNTYDFPTKEAITISTTGKSFKGAHNIEPKPGIFFKIKCLDFEGLYTNIIANNNFSPETMNCPHDECKKSNPVKNSELEEHYWSCTKERGLAAELIQFITKSRSVIFKPLKKENEALWTPVEQSLKVWGNAAYGYVSTESSDWFFMPMAESTTGVGRSAIEKLEQKCIELEITVLRGDTDSVFLADYTDESIKELYEFSKKELGLKLDLEYDGEFIINSPRKKNYFILKTDGTHIIKGLKLKKSNTPALIQKTGKSVINIITKMKTKEDIPEIKNHIEKYTRFIIRKIKDKKGELDEYAYHTKITKSISNYKVHPQHVKSAIIEAQYRLNKLPSAIRHTASVDTLVEVGHIQSYIKIRHKPKAYPLSLSTNKDIDTNKYLEELESTLAPLIELYDINFKELIIKQQSLGSLLK